MAYGQGLIQHQAILNMQEDVQKQKQKRHIMTEMQLILLLIKKAFVINAMHRINNYNYSIPGAKDLSKAGQKMKGEALEKCL